MLLDDERMRLLVRVATMYYVRGRNQEQIAAELKLSRPKISRLLAQAQKAGIVHISIHDPFSSKSQIERHLTERFGLREAIVTTSATEVNAVQASVSVAAAGLLERLIEDGDSISINAGVTLNDTCEAVRSLPRANCVVIPLVGGWGPSGSRWQANLSARTLAQRLGCSYLQLNAPAFVSSAAAKQALLAESEIQLVLSRGRTSDLALVGIGQISMSSTLFKAGFLDAEHLEELWSRGAVANICNSFIDRTGALVPFPHYDRMIGLSTDELGAIRTIVGVASGSSKAEAILAALKAGLLHYFVTDSATAKAILAFDE